MKNPKLVETPKQIDCDETRSIQTSLCDSDNQEVQNNKKMKRNNFLTDFPILSYKIKIKPANKPIMKVSQNANN